MVFCMDHPEFYPTTVEVIKETDIKTVVICGVKDCLPFFKDFMGSFLNKIPKAKSHVPGYLYFNDIIKKFSPKSSLININPTSDTDVIIYTGGTTGRPKCAVLTHSNLFFAVKALGEYMLWS